MTKLTPSDGVSSYSRFNDGSIRHLPNIAICGHSRAGKDEAAEWLQRNAGFRYGGSLSTYITPFAAARLGMSESEAYACRHKHRDLWKAIGIEMRSVDPGCLVGLALRAGNLVVGTRDRCELESDLWRELIHLVIWIERDVPIDPTLEYGSEVAHIVIENNGSLAELGLKLQALVGFSRQMPSNIKLFNGV